MKLLVVLFALAVVTGCQAMTIREAPRSEPKLKELVDKMFTFGWKAFFAASEILEKILESGNTTAINEHLDEISEKVRAQERELPPEMKELMEIVSNLSETYKVKTSWAFVRWMRRHYEEIERVIGALALYVDPVASKALLCMEWLEQNINTAWNQLSEPLDEPLEQAVDSLGSLVTYYNNVLQENEDILQTSLDKAAKDFRLGMETLHKHLKPYWIPFLKEYKKYDPGLRELLEGSLFPAPKED
ncbi:apolipoprotein A-IV-like [Anolis sagrei]|uniref:apolipoprotein A-IV-like n=1 Tax=Anolis sagrei TaxID=38937 RepID=UPI00351FD891